MAVSGDIEKFYYALAAVEVGERRYERHKAASDFGRQPPDLNDRSYVTDMVRFPEVQSLMSDVRLTA